MTKHLLAAIALFVATPVAAQSITGTPGSLTIGGTSTTLHTGTSFGYTISSGHLKAPRTLTIDRTKDCRLVILEDTVEKLVIGCRSEVK